MQPHTWNLNPLFSRSIALSLSRIHTCMHTHKHSHTTCNRTQFVQWTLIVSTCTYKNWLYLQGKLVDFQGICLVTKKVLCLHSSHTQDFTLLLHQNITKHNFTYTFFWLRWFISVVWMQSYLVPQTSHPDLACFCSFPVWVHLLHVVPRVKYSASKHS